MITVAILTQSYPYPAGEQFLEEEIRHWARTPGVQVTLLPLAANGKPRILPANIHVDTSIADAATRLSRAMNLLSAIVSPVFWKEALQLRKTGKLSGYSIAKALYSVMWVLTIRHGLKRCLRRSGGFDLVYCYWNDTQAYAAALLKREGAVPRLISRLHGFDLYVEQRPHGYMPLKWQFLADFDQLYPISSQGRRYLRQTYRASLSTMHVARLGVALPPACAMQTDDGSLHIVSVAFCLPYKRIDRLVDALCVVSQKRPDLRISWTHIGDGPLFEELQAYARSRLTAGSVAWQFLGLLSNEAVRHYFATHAVDLFINSSEVEGVPVSIMEAMSFGVPVIAPDIGAVREIVSGECGVLMNNNPGPADIAGAILAIYPKLKHAEHKRAARRAIEQHYDARRNYEGFIGQLLRDSGNFAAAMQPLTAVDVRRSEQCSIHAVEHRGQPSSCSCEIPIHAFRYSISS
ncbi:glycosyltransferase [Noviherbaspirillum sp. UKPF54]|uniref:glycosyltransferase n=1 Tax=Noviherbaspirillum sp. UKPF54 TaxID=2601898 RepID=UPI0011B1C423|nr:glycosyltransferase [Noviherbaspirillum sp. UKPF54]QDZ28640.1 glycosyltransferase [Noviherbaspirillum sp. UKPF54]